MTAADLDPDRFAIHHFDGRGFRQAYVRENPGGVPLLCVHGWPETKRIWWRVIEPLAAAGFEVIVPDLRGFGDSDVAPDGFHDVASHSRDLHALVTAPESEGGLGHERVVLCGGDLGGPVIQDLALRFPDVVERMVLFNSPLPFDKEAMAGMDTRPRAGAADYFLRQGTDPDGLAAELGHARSSAAPTSPPSTRPGSGPTPASFTDRPLPGGPAVDFHTEPFADGAKLRASFGGYESAFSDGRPVGAGAAGPQPRRRDADPLRSVRPRPVPGVRPDGGGHLPGPRRTVPAARLRPLRAVGGAAPAGLRHPGVLP